MTTYHPYKARLAAVPIKPQRDYAEGGLHVIMSAGDSFRDIADEEWAAIAAEANEVVAINHAAWEIYTGRIDAGFMTIFATMDAHLPKNAEWRKHVDWDNGRLRQDSKVKSRFTFPYVLDKVLREGKPERLVIYGVDHEGGGIQGKKPEKDLNSGRWDEEGAAMREIIQNYDTTIEWRGKWQP